MTAPDRKQIEKYPAYFACADGRIYSTKTNKYLTPSYDKQGYARVGIYIGNYKTKTIKIQRLIAETFIPNPQNKQDVNHINGIKDDNRAVNLEWVTRSENIQHAFDTGLKTIGQNHRNILRKKMGRPVINIVTGKQYPSLKAVALELNVNYRTLLNHFRSGRKNKTNFRWMQK